MSEERRPDPRGLESIKVEASASGVTIPHGPPWTTVRISSLVLAMVEEEAQARGLSKSQLVTELILRGLES